MAEENQVQQDPQQVQQEPQRVATKNPKKVEAGKRLAAHNHRQREKKREEQVQKSELKQYYGIGAVPAVGVIGGPWLLHLSNQERPHKQRSQGCSDAM